MKSSVPSEAGKDQEIQNGMKGTSEPEINMRQIFEDSPIAFYITDSQGYITFFNQASVKLWGRTPEIGKDLWCGSWRIIYGDGSPMPLEECPMAKTLKQGMAFEKEKITIERPDHTFRNLLVFPRPIFDEQGKLTGAHNTLVDITEQQENEIKQATLSAIVESSEDAIISKDLNGNIMSWNYGAECIFKYSEEEILGESIIRLIPEPRQEGEKQILQKIRDGKKLEPFNTIGRDKNGRKFPLSITVSPVKDSEGNIVGVSKIARDISGRVQAQAEIKKHTKNLEILNSVGKNISKKMDVRVVLQQVTNATTNLTGAAFGAFFYNNEDEQGKSMMLFTLSGAPREAFEKFGMPRHTDVFRPTLTGEEGVIRVDDITKDPRYANNSPHFGMPAGHPPVASYMAVPVISTSGTVIGGLFFGHPESGRFKAEHEDLVLNIAAQAAISLDNSKLFEQVKSFSDKKDEFIALASHELRTPITTIKGYLQVLEKKEKNTMSKLFLKKSLSQVNKLNSLVEDLLHMSRIESGRLEFNLENFDLREMLLDIIETFNYSHKTHTLIYELGEAPAIIKGDNQRIEQVIINLLSNAVKYSPKADKVYLKLKIDPGNVTVIVEDEGIGLSEEQQNQIFTRFYRAESTKGISGLGLGLYLAKQIIDRHKGLMKISSKLGRGSQFSFSLPLK